MIFEGPELEIMLSREGVWTDINGVNSGLQTDTALLRCVAGRDFRMKHWTAAAYTNGLLWHLQRIKNMSISDLRHGRRVLMRKLNELAEKPRLSDVEQVEFERHKNSIQSQDARIERAVDARDLEIDAALDALQSGHVIHPAVHDDPYRDDAAAARRGMGAAKGMILGGLAKAMAHSYQHQIAPAEFATRVYGERHPVTETMQKALLAGVGQASGFVIPPDQSLELIELLHPKVALRAARPRMLPIPRGTLTLAAQTAAAAASYGLDVATIADSSQTFGDVVLTYKKLTALTRISNDLLRHAGPAIDAIVRDDLLSVMAIRRNVALIFGDGTNNSPRGLANFANTLAATTGGIAGNWLSTENSTAAVGGQLITSPSRKIAPAASSSSAAPASRSSTVAAPRHGRERARL